MILIIHAFGRCLHYLEKRHELVMKHCTHNASCQGGVKVKVKSILSFHFQILRLICATLIMHELDFFLEVQKVHYQMLQNMSISSYIYEHITVKPDELP